MKTLTLEQYRMVRAEAMSERDLQKTVREFAELHGWAQHVPYDSRKGPSGWPDLTFMRPPRLVFIELKSQKGTLRPDQDVMLELLRQYCWAEVFVFRPIDWLEDKIQWVLR